MSAAPGLGALPADRHTGLGSTQRGRHLREKEGGVQLCADRPTCKGEVIDMQASHALRPCHRTGGSAVTIGLAVLNGEEPSNPITPNHSDAPKAGATNP